MTRQQMSTDGRGAFEDKRRIGERWKADGKISGREAQVFRGNGSEGLELSFFFNPTWISLGDVLDIVTGSRGKEEEKGEER